MSELEGTHPDDSGSREASLFARAASALDALISEGWPREQALHRVVRAIASALADARGLLLPAWEPPPDGALFASADARSFRELCARVIAPEEAAVLDVTVLGRAYERLVSPEARRRAGAHYTSQELTKEIVARTLAPLLAPSREAVLALRVCDPAMGSGAFLVEACRVLARASEVRPAAESPTLAEVASRCLYGVDLDPFAVLLARTTLWLLAGDPALPPGFLDEHLVAGNALLGPAPADDPARPAPPEGHGRPVDWAHEFSHVFAREDARGFDACLGNPPWVAYAGRAAQPLDPALRDFYVRTSPAFFGYRTLQALFVQRAVSVLRPGGRLGLVLPTSMSDLDGYAPCRRAHDALAVADHDLPDFGADAFEGVFQPSMGLLSTRRANREEPPDGPWPLARTDLDPTERALLTRLGALPTLPGHLFGERGFQSMGDDVARMAKAPEGRRTKGLRRGGDVTAFLASPPSFYCDPEELGSRFRADEAWSEVALLVRQTARYPMAALSDGLPFRNSVLAAFADDAWPAFALLAYLNASPVRWYHFARHRDARQGMPQLKIGHLRALPAPPRESVGPLAAVGEHLGRRNRGVTEDEQRELDALVADAFSLSAEERGIVTRWAARTRG